MPTHFERADPREDARNRAAARGRTAELLLCTAGAIAGVAMALHNSQDAFVGGTLTLMFGALLCLSSVLTRNARRALEGALFLAIFGLNVSMCGTHTQRLEARAAPTIAAIEDYRAQHGQFPDEPAIFSRSIGAIELPDCPDRYPVVYSRHQHQEQDAFSLTCVTFGFNKHMYRSELGHWVDWD